MRDRSMAATPFGVFERGERPSRIAGDDGRNQAKGKCRPPDAVRGRRLGPGFGRPQRPTQPDEDGHGARAAHQQLDSDATHSVAGMRTRSTPPSRHALGRPLFGVWPLSHPIPSHLETADPSHKTRSKPRIASVHT
jgi:hypothetical protein